VFRGEGRPNSPDPRAARFLRIRRETYEAEGDEEAQQAARRWFQSMLTEEDYGLSEAGSAVPEGAIVIPKSARDAWLLLDQKDLCWNWNTNSSWSSGRREGWRNRAARRGTPKEEKGLGFRTSGSHGVAPAHWRWGGGRLGRPKEGPPSMGGLSQ